MGTEGVVAEAARQALQAQGDLGAAVALRVDDVPVLEAGLGWRGAGRTVPMPADALLQTYSISKTLFAMVALRLSELGALDLDAAAPGCPAGVTPRRLLNHTAGVPDYGMVPAYHEAVRTTPGRAWTEFMARTVGASGFGPVGPGRSRSSPACPTMPPPKLATTLAVRREPPLVAHRACGIARRCTCQPMRASPIRPAMPTMMRHHANTLKPWRDT